MFFVLLTKFVLKIAFPLEFSSLKSNMLLSYSGLFNIDICYLYNCHFIMILTKNQATLRKGCIIRDYSILTKSGYLKNSKERLTWN